MLKEIIPYNMPHNTPIRFRCAEYNKDSLFLSSFHIHNEIEIIYVTNGTLICRYNNKEKTLSKGDIIIFNKNSIHETEANSETSLYSLQIPIEFFLADNSQLLYALTDTQSVLSLTAEDTHYNEIKGYMENFSLHRHSEEQLPREFTLGYAYLVISFLKKVNMISTFVNENDENIPKLLPALNYMKENYKEKLTVSQIAKTVSFNTNYFERIFKKTFNITVVEYINSLRLNKAVRLMFTTEKKLTEISDTCGFSSSAHFNMIFKKKYKMPPSAYKKAKRSDFPTTTTINTNQD